MKRVILPLMLAAGLALPAAAATLDELYQNTLILTDGQGRTTTVLVSEGGRLEQVNGAGMWAAGFWAKDGDSFCWTARGEAQVCIPLAADKGVGDTWEVSGPTGKVAWTAGVVAGRADLRKLSAAPVSGGGHH